MKEEILKRAMFAMPLSKDARNSGILSGFDMDEMGEMPEPEEASEEMPQMSRTPQNPEILMNTLRGDMRSVDARYQELAQMVGEEAAMETPPEVLAMLQMQLGAQQGGIGALPEGQGMMPPGMPPQPGQQPPAGPQGIAAAMPPGMASAPPFPQGGAEQAPPQQFSHGGAVEPPTPDGMPPMHAQAGAPVSMATRTAQWMGDKIGPYANAANVALGRFFMSPQFGVERMTGGAPAIPLTVQRGETLLMNPQTGQVFQGAGSRLAPYTSLSTLTAPTFTEGLGRGAAQLSIGAQNLAQQYPRLAGALVPVAAAGTWLDTMLSRSPQDTPENEARRQALIDQIPIDTRQEIEDRIQARENQIMAEQEVKRLSENYPFFTAPPEPTASPAPGEEKGDLDAFIAEKLAAKEAQWAKEGQTPAAPLSKADRIRAARNEYSDLYKELLGDTKSDMQTNALLMLADAGFKYAGAPVTPGSTPISRLSQAASGIPQGFMGLLAQAKERQMKVDTAALSQAVNDIQMQDQQAFQLQRDAVQGFYKVQARLADKGGVQVENLGGGIGNYSTKDGGYMGTAVMMVPDGKGGQKMHPAAETILASPYTLRKTDNSWVEDRGPSPLAVASTKEEVKAATTRIDETSSALKSLDNIQGIYTRAFGPGAWFQDKVNNLIVPLSSSMATKQGLDLEGTKTELKAAINSLSKSIASEGADGRLSNQVQEWARDVLEGLDKPTAFWSSPEFMAKRLSTLRTMLLNARQEQLPKLGLEKSDLVMRAPNLGTQTDPFVIPSDPEEQQRMINFLSGTVGRTQDPRALVFIRDPGGTVRSVSPSKFRSQVQ